MSNYIYNGVELPALPEWDKEVYPYATIHELPSGTYWFCVATAPWFYRPSDEAYAQRSSDYPVSFIKWVCHANRENLSWDLYKEYPNSTSVGWCNFQIIPELYGGWTNHNILNMDDGTIVLQASDPVPVPTLTARDLYRKINGKPTKLTLYKNLGGKLVALDEHTKEVTHD